MAITKPWWNISGKKREKIKKKWTINKVASKVFDYRKEKKRDKMKRYSFTIDIIILNWKSENITQKEWVNYISGGIFSYHKDERMINNEICSRFSYKLTPS